MKENFTAKAGESHFQCTIEGTPEEVEEAMKLIKESNDEE